MSYRPTFAMPADAGWVVAQDMPEYPTDRVSFVYLGLINKVKLVGRTIYQGFVTAPDVFTDKAVVIGSHNVGTWLQLGARVQDKNNQYYVQFDTGATTPSQLLKVVAGAQTIMSSGGTAPDTLVLVIEATGSTIKGLAYDASSPLVPYDPSTWPAASISLSATDTNFTEGLYGHGTMRPSKSIDAAYLMDPLTPLPKALTVIDVPVTGSGKDDDPIRPDLPQNLVEINSLTSEQKAKLSPEILKQAQRYYTLKNKGYTDEEIEAIVGTKLVHQVDLNAVTYGSFDHKGENTMAIVVTGANPLNPKAVQDVLSTAKEKNWKIYKVPTSLADVGDVHKELRKEHPDIIAGKHDLAYRTLGHADLEPLAVADYYGGFVEGTYDPKHLERVPDWELKRIINHVWKPRLKAARVGGTLKSQHEERLNKALKLVGGE